MPSSNPTRCPSSGDTASMNDVASAFYAPPTTFDKPENEQIKIVEV
jgi:hypothetical protein